MSKEGDPMDVVVPTEIDEGLYSRQLYVLGHEAQRKMASSNILIAGLNGVGVEVAKNIILAGVKSVSLYDPKPVTFEDLSAQFYASEENLGLSRAAASVNKLAELNPYVSVSLAEDVFSPTTISQFNVIVVIDLSLKEQMHIAELCRQQGSLLIIADVLGAFGRVFCDLGDSFTVYDPNGELAPSSMITQITKGNPALVTVLEENRHGLETGDFVELTDIEGMTELNGLEVAVTVRDPHIFEIPIDTSNFTPYIRGGYVKAVKKPIKLSFQPLATAIDNPGEFICDAVKFARAGPLHLCFRSYYGFLERVGRPPIPGSLADADVFIEVAKELNQEAASKPGAFKIDNIDEESGLIRRFAMSCRGQISPICSILGGVVGQEVIKAISGKFTPIKQWFYYDALDALAATPLPEEEVSPVGSRYDSQIMLFGRTLTQRLMSLNIFMVGAGAIGCELLKNFAMMGIACSQDGGSRGIVHVTDMDRIEKSNLSRQFLFRSTDINQLKSETAIRAAKAMNPAFRGIAYETKVAPDSEGFFNDDFFESLDAVFTALDNVEARLYVDQRCMFYHVPLFESGTLGAKGHTQVVVPGLTEHYGATRDPPEKSIPVCTLKHFPNQIEHTLQWAREWFEEVFMQTPEDCNKYLSSPLSVPGGGLTPFEQALAAQQNMKLDTLTRVHEALTSTKPRHFKDCVLWARLRFEDMFSSKIKQLLHAFPLDRLTTSGTPFWSGAKKPPTPLNFNPSDALHAEFILASAVLRARVYGIHVPPEFNIENPNSGAAFEITAKYLGEVAVPEFKPADGVKIPTTEEEAKNETSSTSAASINTLDIDAECKRIMAELPTPAPPLLTALDFDKDNDSHLRAIAACSNLRARNYGIEEADLYKSRGIAGKITPAIATTTALVSGAISLELFKVLQKLPVDKLMNTFCNLALPLFTGMEPEPPSYHTATVKGQPWKWSQWDRIDIADPGMTLKGLIGYMKAEYGVDLSMLSSGVSILYSDFMNKKKIQERLNQNLKTLVSSITKKEIPEQQKYLILEMVVVDSDSGEEVELPYLRMRLSRG